ncbi:MAG: putative 2-dehydropantoate 2-reductase [Chitinispirillaceae bacterium]|nr:putative 2-dehydropantoate 2-reductase [Chitinispirillaceae bacterium]
MSKKKRVYAIVGTGAIGGYYGALLQRSGLEVHFLLRSDYNHVANYGLKIESVNGNFDLPLVNAHSSVKTMPQCDVVVVALKTTQNDSLKEILPPLLKEDSIVIVMQNGLGTEEMLSRELCIKNIIGALCFICSYKISAGVIHHLDYGHVSLGEFSFKKEGAGITQKLKEILEDFSKAGIEVKGVENLILYRWKKLVWNIPFNGLSVILNSTTDLLIKNQESRFLIIELMKEVIAGARACGYFIEEEFISEMIESTEKMKPYKTSMKLDYEKGQPLEIESIYGYPLKVAEQNGASMPFVKMLYKELLFLNDKNIKGSKQTVEIS